MATLCDNQTTFNLAIKKALDAYKGRESRNSKSVMLIASIIWLVLTVWAVTVAMNVPDKDHRTLHIFLALVSGPVYLISSLVL